MDINSESVKNGLIHLSLVTKNIQETRKYIAIASDNLDRRISNHYGEVKELLRKIELTEHEIVDLCNDFIETTESTVDFIGSSKSKIDGEVINTRDNPLLPQETSINGVALAKVYGITSEDILLLGKGPINPELLTMNDIVQIQQTKANERNRQILLSSGYTPEDVNRVLNGEITLDELNQEIYEDYCNGNSDRFKALLNATQLDKYYFSRSETELLLADKEARLEYLLSEESGEEKSKLEREFALYNLVVEEAVFDESSKLYRYTFEDSKETITFTEEDFASLKETRDYLGEKLDNFDENKRQEIEDLETEIGNLNAMLGDAGKREFTYSTMAELDAGIEELNARIAEIDQILSGKDLDYESYNNLNTNWSCIKVNDHTYVVIDGAGNRKTYTSLDDLLADGFNMIPTKDTTQSILEGKGLNSWFGIDNTSIDTTGWTCVKIAPNKYCLMDGNKNHIDMRGNRSYDTFTVEELVNNGFYLPPDHRVQLDENGELIQVLEYNQEVDLPDRLENQEMNVWFPLLNESIRGEWESDNPELIARRRELILERDFLLETKSNVEANTNYNLKYDKYTMQPDFKTKSQFKAAPAQDITYYRNDWHIIINIFGIEAGRYNFMDTPEYRGALLARMLNCDAIILPDIEGNALNVCGDEGQEFYFYGDERQIFFNEFQQWINAVVVDPNTGKELRAIYPSEIAVFNYICNTQGYEAGYQYLMSMRAEFDRRNAAIQTAKDANFARTNVLSGTLALFTEPFIALANAGTIMRKKSRGDEIFLTNVYNPANTWHTTLAADMGKQYGAGWEKAYNIVYSLDQSMMNLLVAYATGGSSLSVTLSSTFIMGLPVFNASFYDAKTKGIDDNTALLLSGLKATTEIVMESFSLTHLLGLEAAYQNALSSGTVVSLFSNRIKALPAKMQPFAEKLLLTSYCMVSQGLIGGEEELATEVLDHIWDFALSKENSLAYKKFMEYKKLHPNCTDFEASAFAISQVMDTGWDAFTSGFIAEAIMGGAGHVNSGTPNLSPYTGMDFQGPSIDDFTFPGSQQGSPSDINPDSHVGEDIDIREDTQGEGISPQEDSSLGEDSQIDSNEEAKSAIPIQEDSNIPESIRNAIKNGTSVNGRIEIPADVLLDNEIKIYSKDKICFDETTNQFIRVDSNGNILAVIDPELLYGTNLRDASMRLMRDDVNGIWVDRITGFYTPIQPNYNWSTLLSHLNGEFKNRRSTGLHSFESFASQLKDGTISIKVGENLYTSVDVVTDTATGDLVIKGTDGAELDRVAPDANGFISIDYWEYTSHPRRGATSKTLFPAGINLQAIADEFNSIPNKVPTHLQIKENSTTGQINLRNAYYEFEYTIPETGEKIDIIVEVTNGEIASMYPKGEMFNSGRPNTFDVVTKSNNSSGTQVSVEQIVADLTAKYGDNGLSINVENDSCTVKVGDDSFVVPSSELGNEATREQIEMLTDSDYFRIRNIYSNDITNVSISDGKYRITTIHGDVITLSKEDVESGLAKTALDMVTSFDYKAMRDYYQSSIDSVTCDPLNKTYTLVVATGETITFDTRELSNGLAENKLIAATDPNILDFRERNKNRIESFSYDGKVFRIVANKFGDIIEERDLFKYDVQLKIDMLTDERYLNLREKYPGKFISVAVSDGKYHVSVLGVNSRRTYTFSFSPGEMDNQTINDSIDMMLSEEYDNFYISMCFINNFILGITVKNGRYVITRLNGSEIYAERGGLSDSGLLNQLFFDSIVNKHHEGLSSWSRDGDNFKLVTTNGDTIILNSKQLRNPKIYNMIGVMISDQQYAKLKKHVGDIIKSTTIDEEGKLVITTTYGDTFALSSEIINSENLFYDMIAYKYRHEAILMEDGRYRIVDKYGQEYFFTESELADDANLINIYNLTIEYENDLVNDWIINNILELPSKITPKQQAAMDAKVDEIAYRVGATREEVYSAIRQGLNKVVSESAFGDRISMDTLQAILTSWIKNQHESNSSNGAYNPRERRRLENALFFVPSTVDASDAAVYGMLFPDLNTASDTSKAINYYRSGPGYWYGRGDGDKTQVVLIFNKSKIMDNTTITIGDSLDYAYYQGVGPGIQAGAPATNPEYLGSFEEFLDGVTSLDEIKNASLETFAPNHSYRGDQYIEIQVHGRYAHSIDVIEEIVFLVEPDPVVTKMLDNLNIPWRVI